MKIAFLFLIYDEIVHEDLWAKFFKGVDPSLYTIYIHYKEDKKLKHFEKFKLKNCVETEFADVSLIYANNVMLREALKDKDNKKFVNLSQSCIPFKSFDHVYSFLTSDDKAHFFHAAKRHKCFPRCDSLLEYIPRNKIDKSNQWFILNRIIAERSSMEKSFYLDYLYKDVYAPEEHYYITLVNELGLQDTVDYTDTYMDQATTFVNWNVPGLKYKYKSQEKMREHPKEYFEIQKEELNYLLNARCLFGRKFHKDCFIIDKEEFLDEYMLKKL
jgi:hypothetical protein